MGPASGIYRAPQTRRPGRGNAGASRGLDRLGVAGDGGRPDGGDEGQQAATADRQGHGDLVAVRDVARLPAVGGSRDVEAPPCRAAHHPTRPGLARNGASRSCRCYDRRAVPARPPAPPAGHSPKPALRSPRRGTRTKRIPARAAASWTRTTMIRRVQPRSTRHAEGDHLQRADASPSALAGDLNVYCTSCATLTTLTTMSSSAYIHSMRSDFVLSATLAPTNAKGTDATPNTSVIAQLM